jgi:hypothetical protein
MLRFGGRILALFLNSSYEQATGKSPEPAHWKVCATRSAGFLACGFWGLSSPQSKNSGQMRPVSAGASAHFPQWRIFSQIGWTNQVRFETVVALRNQAQTPPRCFEKGWPSAPSFPPNHNKIRP